MKPLQKKINDAIDVLDRNMGYLYDLLISINVAPISHKVCDTAMACLDKEGKKHIFVSDKLVRELEDYELQLVIYHELMHIMYDHLSTQTDLYKKFAQNPNLANIAQDCIINEVIGLLPKNVKHPVLKAGVTPDYISKIVGEKVSAKTHSVEDVFDLLLDAENEGNLPDNLKKFDDGLSEVGLLPQDVQDAIQKILGGSGGEKASPNDVSDNDSDVSKSHGNNSSNGKYDQEADEVDGNGSKGPSSGDESDEGEGELGSNRDSDSDNQNDLLEKACQGYSKSGSFRDGPYFKEKITGINANRKILSQIKKILKQVKISKKNTLKRPNRRFSGNPIGRTKMIGQKVLIGVDVSGSMSSAILQGNVARAIHSCMSSEIQLDIVWGDTRELGREYNITKKFDLAKIRGGGGTELSFMFKGLEEYSAFICITDGDFNHKTITQKQKDVSLFLIVPEWGARAVKGAKNINAKTGEVYEGENY